MAKKDWAAEINSLLPKPPKQYAPRQPRAMTPTEQEEMGLRALMASGKLEPAKAESLRANIKPPKEGGEIDPIKAFLQEQTLTDIADSTITAQAQKGQVRPELAEAVKDAVAKKKAAAAESLVVRLGGKIPEKRPTEAAVVQQGWIERLRNYFRQRGGAADFSETIGPVSQKPITKVEYDKLPVGSKYMAPDGTIRTKK